MYVVSAALSEPATVMAPEGLENSYGVPCVFKGCSGFYHPAGGTIGVVLCSPWGFEDLTMRKSWRLLAEAIATAGYPCIRFDYPGTGNSAGRATDVASIATWTTSIEAAADFLRLNSGVRRFVFIGQSLGAVLAVAAARTRSDVVGVHLITPVVRGRAYVRELAATATMVAERIGIKLELAPDEGLSVLGFAMSRAMVESLKSFDLTKIDKLDVPHAVIYDQVDRKSGVEAAEHLRKLGLDIAIEALEPYHLFVSDATAIQPLPVSAGRIIETLLNLHPTAATSVPAAPAFPSALVTDTFREEPIRFGVDGDLFGVLCRPPHERQGAPAVVLLNRGLNAHIGWRRVSVDQARGLAAAGITSLRIDVAGLGESRDTSGRPANPIYSELLLPDIRAAVDALIARGHERIALAGVCSGAYMALIAARADLRVTDVVAVNAQRFVWNPAESVEDVIRYGLRSMNDYVGDIKKGNAFKKLLRSRRRIVPAARFLARRSLRNLMARVPLKLRSIVLRGSMAARVNAFFEALAANDTRVSLVFSENDPGLMELRHYFGPEGRDLRFDNVTLSILPDADHNLTASRAADWMLEHLIAFNTAALPRDDARLATPRRRETRHAACPDRSGTRPTYADTRSPG